MNRDFKANFVVFDYSDKYNKMSRFLIFKIIDTPMYNCYVIMVLFFHSNKIIYLYVSVTQNIFKLKYIYYIAITNHE